MPTDPIAILATTALIVAAVTWLSPRWTLLLLLAALPFATHHPSSAPTVLLIVLTAVFQVVYAVRVHPSAKRAWAAVTGQPMLLFGALFVLAAFMSLSSMPLLSIWHEHVAAWDQSTFGETLLDWLLLVEGRREFAITSTLLTLQGFVLALIVWRETNGPNAMDVRIPAAIAVGMLVSIVLGLLDAFGWMSLDVFRSARIGSSVARAGTLQSVSGNPGWYSEYLVYAMPYTLVVLAATTAIRWRVAVLALVSGLTAFALLVSFQRGGWISGGVLLIYMALAAVSLARAAFTGIKGSGAPGWRGLVYIAVVLVMVAGGFTFWVRDANPAGLPLGGASYLQRFKSIVSGDRVPYMRAGIRFAALHPVLGGGHESFAYRYQLYVDREGGPYHGTDIRVPNPASAHSLYFQTLTGTGTVGLACLVGMFVVAASIAQRARRRGELDLRRRATLAAASGSLLGIACYGLVQEVFYVHALRLLFFVAVGLVAGVGTDLIQWPVRVRRALWLALGMALIVHLTYEYAWPGPDRLLRAGEHTGLHVPDPGSEERDLRWTTDRATWPVPDAATRYTIRVRSLAPYAQEVEIRACAEPARTWLTDHEWHQLEGSVEPCSPGSRLRLSVTPTWSPKGDFRTLGVLVSAVRIE